MSGDQRIKSSTTFDLTFYSNLQTIGWVNKNAGMGDQEQCGEGETRSAKESSSTTTFSRV